MPLQPRPEITAMQPYVPGKSVLQVQRELGLTDMVKLSQNENPLGASPRAVAAALRALEDAHVYPECISPDLRAALAGRWRLDPEWILVGNGSDEVFRLLAECYLRPRDAVVIPAPSFAGYRLVAELMGAACRFVPLAGGTMDLPAMAAACRETGARLVFLCRPNNPTGGVFPAADFGAFMAGIPDGTLVVLDEAYREFDGTAFDGREQVLHWPNLVVTRTFSKLYGLAGLRAGYGVAHPDIWAPALTARDPFSVNLVAQAAALAALDDQEHISASVDMTRWGRQWLTEQLAPLPVTVHPSEANFILIDVRRAARPVYEALLQSGVITRPCGSFGLPTCIRVTIGTEPELGRFVAALRQVLAAS